MRKSFDEWNEQKKYIDDDRNRPFYHEREIWWCSLGMNIGVEQDGTGNEYQRPAVILRGFSAESCIIVPFTTSQKENKYHIDAGLTLGEQDYAIISQLRLIDTKRLIERAGYMDKKNFEYIRKANKGML